MSFAKIVISLQKCTGCCTDRQVRRKQSENMGLYNIVMLVWLLVIKCIPSVPLICPPMIILSKTKCDYPLKVNSYASVVLILKEGSVLTIHVMDGSKSGH